MSGDGGPEDTTQVAYLGPPASFSHQAALNIFQTTPNTIVHPVSSFAEIFTSLQGTEFHPAGILPTPLYDYGVIPIENSTNGSVVQVYDLLVQIPQSFPDLEIIAEYYLPVHHCLFVRRNCQSTTFANGKDIEVKPPEIATLYTHPQVWGQCTRYLAQHFPGIERIDCSSTSAAAKLVAKDMTGTTAAIGSRLAGDANGLVCLAEEIEDDPDGNMTRFFVIRRRTSNAYVSADPFDYVRVAGGRGGEDNCIKYKSMITFTVPHTKPGSLADVLAVFREFDFNLTSIDTRPSRERNWEYVFFVECEETKLPEEEGRLEELLEEMGRRTQKCRWLGRWVDMLWYRQIHGKEGDLQ